MALAETLHNTRDSTQVSLRYNCSLARYFNYLLVVLVREGFKKKKKKNYGRFHIGSWPPFFFLKLDHFWELFVKSVFLPLKTQKNYFQTSKFLPPQKPNFAATCAITATRRKILSTTRTILALTWFCHLSMYLWILGGGLEEPQGGTPPYTWKKLQCLKMIFRPFGAKK